MTVKASWTEKCGFVILAQALGSSLECQECLYLGSYMSNTRSERSYQSPSFTFADENMPASRTEILANLHYSLAKRYSP